MQIYPKQIKFEEYIRLLERVNDELMNRSIHAVEPVIKTNLPPTRLRDELLKTNKFVSASYPNFQGRYHMNHPATNTILLLRYCMDEKDREANYISLKKAKDSWIQILINPDYLRNYKILLPDMLSFAKSIECTLEGNLPYPLRARFAEYAMVSYIPSNKTK